VLETGTLLTQKEIIEKTYLPPRTVRYAINRLRSANVLVERFYFKDARQSLYGLRNRGDHCITMSRRHVTVKIPRYERYPGRQDSMTVFRKRTMA